MAAGERSGRTERRRRSKIEAALAGRLQSNTLAQHIRIRRRGIRSKSPAKLRLRQLHTDIIIARIIRRRPRVRLRSQISALSPARTGRAMACTSSTAAAASPQAPPPSPASAQPRVAPGRTLSSAPLPPLSSSPVSDHPGVSPAPPRLRGPPAVQSRRPPPQERTAPRPATAPSSPGSTGKQIPMLQRASDRGRGTRRAPSVATLSCLHASTLDSRK